MIRFYSVFYLCLLFFYACRRQSQSADAYGYLEAEKTTISAQSSGILAGFDVREGSTITKGQKMGVIDTVRLHFERNGTLGHVNALRSKIAPLAPQLDLLYVEQREKQSELKQLKNRLAHLQEMQRRYSNVYGSGGITKTDMDEADLAVRQQLSSIEIASEQLAGIGSKITLLKESLRRENKSLVHEGEAGEQKIEAITNDIEKSTVYNPINGILLRKYVRSFEFVVPGTRLYTVANLKELYFRAYVSQSQLHHIKIGQTVAVSVDSLPGVPSIHEGRLEWISEEPEFTPKNVQTPEERARQVYAVKIALANPTGNLKIGMYADVRF